MALSVSSIRQWPGQTVRRGGLSLAALPLFSQVTGTSACADDRVGMAGDVLTVIARRLPRRQARVPTGVEACG